MIKLSKKLQLKLVKLGFKLGGAISPRLVAKIAYRRFFTRPFRHKPLTMDMGLLNSAFKVKELFDDKHLQGYVWGEGDKCIILAHGWSSHALTMRKFIPSLIKHGFKIIAFDAPAHGNSEGKTTTGLQYRCFLKLLLAKYKPYAIIAHSLGGICALAALSELPDIKVDKIITLASPLTSKIMIMQFLRQANLHKFTYRYFHHYVEYYTGIHPRLFDLNYWYPDGIKHPGMIIHDVNDKVIPYIEAIKLAKIWPQAKLITTQGLGHSGILKDFTVVNQIINYIISDNK